MTKLAQLLCATLCFTLTDVAFAGAENAVADKEKLAKLVADGKFDDARKYAETLKDVDKWCFGYYPDSGPGAGNCYSEKTESPVPKWLEAVTYTWRC